MNHRLSIEFGRCVNIERADRKCKLCQTGVIGDEYHYLLTCFKDDRKGMLCHTFTKIQIHLNFLN